MVCIIKALCSGLLQGEFKFNILFLNILLVLSGIIPYSGFTRLSNVLCLQDLICHSCSVFCNILTFDPAINREIGASGRRYRDITLTVDGLNSVQMRFSHEAGGRQAMI